MSIDIQEFTIPPLGEGSGDAESTAREMINNRLGMIETDLNELVQRVAQTMGKSAIVRQYVPLSANVFTGALVYFDTTTKLYTPALAQLRGIPGTQGQSIEAECARVEGIVLSTYTDNSNNILGTLLIGGCWQDDEQQGYPVLTGALGSNATIAGTYYLSDEVAGMATPDPGVHLRQPILSNQTNGMFSLNIFYMAHDNHFHGSRVLRDNWVAVATELPTGVTEAPEGATCWYDGSADALYTGIGELSSITTAVFYNGVLEYTTDNFAVDQGYLWFKGATPPATGTVTVFNHYPFAYGSPVLRSVESGNNAMTVTTSNGRVIIQANDFIGGSISNNAVAISSIAGNVVQFTPVVSGMAAGPGIKLDTAINGVVTVSSEGDIDVPLDAYSVFHKGTNVVCDDMYIYMVFPAGRMSSLVMNMPVKNVDPATVLRAYAYCVGVGTGSSFSVNFYWTPQPTIAAATSLGGTSIGSSTINYSGEAADSVTYAETPDSVDITGPGQLAARISINSAPTSEVRLMRVGFRLEVAQAALSTASVTNVTNVNAMINTMTAGATISHYDCVKAVEGELKLCTSAVASDVNNCIGVAIDSGMQGMAIRYLIQGIIENNEFSFTAGAPIFISPSGTLTQVNPATDSGAAYIRRIGTALTPSIVQISLEPGIIKE